MKTENEIIKETVEFYWADPSRRAATEQGCKYQTVDGRMCAVGRCLTAEALQRASGMACATCVLADRLEVNCLDELLQPEYRGHHAWFWLHLQILHDDDGIWWGSEELLRDRLKHRFPGFPRETLNLTRNP